MEKHVTRLLTRRQQLVDRWLAGGPDRAELLVQIMDLDDEISKLVHKSRGEAKTL